MVKIFDVLIPKTTPPEKQVWNDPDPGIQWALDILEPPGGGYQEKIFNRLCYPFMGLVAGVGTIASSNIMRKIPLKANLMGYLGLGFVGVYTGEYVRHRVLSYKAEELATVKHYIMLHPEKFPEPEPMKYGDKKVFYPWLPNRRPQMAGY